MRHAGDNKAFTCYFNVHGLAQQKIGVLQVPVDNVQGVHVRYSLADLSKQIASFVFHDASGAEIIVQRSIFHQLHFNETLLVRFNNLKDFHDVLVGKEEESFDLSWQEVPQVALCHVGLFHDFQCHLQVIIATNLSR